MKIVERIWLPDSDGHFQYHLERGERWHGRGTYQFVKIQLAMAHCPVGRRRAAIDVGAHVGLWSMVLSETFERVAAYEPVPGHIECFRRNLEERDNVTLYPLAVGANCCSVNIDLGDGVNSGNACVSDFGELMTTMTRLDDHCASDDVDFIKIDVEGFEREVVAGAERIIRTQKPALVVEQKHNDDALKLLRDWGMKVAWHRSGDYCLTWSDEQ
jgi:FkbM family methyltransferase